MFIFLYTLVYFDYVKTVQKNVFVDWDVKTITAGDYSIEFDIDRSAYEHWRKNYCDENSLLNESSQFKLYIQNELEKRITAMPSQGFEEGDPDIKIS